MSLPTRNNPYSFEEFLEKRRTFNYYLDDPFYQTRSPTGGGILQKQ